VLLVFLRTTKEKNVFFLRIFVNCYVSKLPGALLLQIHGKLEGVQLYTQAYVTRIRAMIRGAIRALMIPTNLSNVWDVLQQQLLETSGGSGIIIGEGKLFQSLFNGLLKEGAFSGFLRGGGSIWIPAVRFSLFCCFCCGDSL
jgi:hypothetical protein